MTLGPAERVTPATRCGSSLERPIQGLSPRGLEVQRCPPKIP